MTGVHIHVIPVDTTLTAEQAWDELCLIGVRATDTGAEIWGVIRCDGTECERITHA